MATETFLDYGIKIPYRRIHGNVKCVCPKCKTSGRTHPEDKSLSVNLDEGIWNCHYCGWSGGLKGFDRSNIRKAKREYTKPKEIQETGLSQKLINYFSLRGISVDTLKKMHIAEGMEFMPQAGREMNTVQFPYYLDGELVNVKYRTGDKKFKMVQGAELIPYNIDSIKDKDTAYLVEGECYPPNAQVFTPTGWLEISELIGEEKVAQWENGVITFAKPLALVRKPFKGDLVEFRNGRNNYYSLTTPGHNLVTIGKTGRIRKIHAEDVGSQVSIPRSGFHDGSGIPLPDNYIRLLIAVSADFTIRKGGDIYGALKKQRKIDRMKMLLDSIGVRYSMNRDKRGYMSVFIHRGQIKDAFKEFPNEWLSQASARQVQIILDELVVWDGNSVKNRTMKEYSTKLYHNAVWVQTLCHLGGMMSTICHRKNQRGEWYKVTMLFKSHSSINRGMRTDVPYDGLVYCCTMPAGTLLVRQNGRITVSGNCDALSFVEAGIDNVISVPNGANNNLEWLDDFMDWFDDMKTIYIAVDNDDKGVMLKEELIRRFGAERCMIVNWSDGCKDANDQLKKYGKDSLRYCVDAAQDVKVGGIYYLEDYESNLDMLYRNGAPKGNTVGWPKFDELISFTTKRIMIVTGVPGHGKSQVVLEIAVRLNLRYGWKTAFFSPESQPMESHAQELIQVLIGKSFNPSYLHMSESEYQMGKNYIRDNFFHIMPEDNQTIATILEKAQFLVRRRGIKMLVIDPYSSIDTDFGTQSETNYIRAMLEALRNFALRNDLLVILVAHPTKIRKDKDHDGVPTMYDVAGSAHFLNKTDYGIVVYRDFDNDCTQIKVEKVKSRFLGHKGDALFKFNINNGRYVPWEKDYASVSWDNSNWLKPASGQIETKAEEPKYQTTQPEELPSAPSEPYQTVQSNYDFIGDDECPF